MISTEKIQARSTLPKLLSRAKSSTPTILAEYPKSPIHPRLTIQLRLKMLQHENYIVLHIVVFTKLFKSPDLKLALMITHLLSHHKVQEYYCVFKHTDLWS